MTHPRGTSATYARGGSGLVLAALVAGAVVLTGIILARRGSEHPS